MSGRRWRAGEAFGWSSDRVWVAWYRNFFFFNVILFFVLEVEGCDDVGGLFFGGVVW